MPQAKLPKPKRTSVGCTLPPPMADRLHRESDARLVAPSFLIEKALTALFEEMDGNQQTLPVDGSA
jgi:hypothetical protein